MAALCSGSWGVGEEGEKSDAQVKISGLRVGLQSRRIVVFSPPSPPKECCVERASIPQN